MYARFAPPTYETSTKVKADIHPQSVVVGTPPTVVFSKLHRTKKKTFLSVVSE